MELSDFFQKCGVGTFIERLQHDQKHGIQKLRADTVHGSIQNIEGKGDILSDWTVVALRDEARSMGTVLDNLALTRTINKILFVEISLYE